MAYLNQVQKIKQFFSKIDPCDICEMDQQVIELCNKYEKLKDLVRLAYIHGYNDGDLRLNEKFKLVEWENKLKDF